MAGRLVRSKEVGRDLDDIFAWIAADQGLGVAAAQMVRLEGAFHRLATFPRLGVMRSDLRGSPLVLTVRPWLVIYELIDGGVEVLRVLDDRRDLSEILGGGR